MSFHEGKERERAITKGRGIEKFGLFFCFVLFFRKGEIVANRNDLIVKESFMMEAKKDIFGAMSLSRQEGMVYGMQAQGLVLASSTDRVQRTWGQMQIGGSLKFSYVCLYFLTTNTLTIYQ